MNNAGTNTGRPMRFGEFLYENTCLSEEQLIEALADHWSNGGTIGTAICRRGFLSREEIEQWAEIFHGVQLLELDSDLVIELDAEPAGPEEFAASAIPGPTPSYVHELPPGLGYHPVRHVAS